MAQRKRELRKTGDSKDKKSTVMGGSRGVKGGPDPPPPLRNHKNIGFLSNTDPDLLENLIATKSAFNVGLSSARQRSTI